MTVKVEMYVLPAGRPPTRGSEEAAGWDLYARLKEATLQYAHPRSNRLSELTLPEGVTNVVLEPGCRMLIPLGIKVALPPGYELQIRPRSGLALKHGISVVNAPGTLDSDFRGEAAVILINHGHESYIVNHGDRVAQAVIAPIPAVTWDHVPSEKHLREAKRGENGYGSSGK